MVKGYSQRLTPPYSGLVQIAESDSARAITMDGSRWEFHFLFDIPEHQKTPGRQNQRRFKRVAAIDSDQVEKIATQSSPETAAVDQRIVELAAFIATSSFPFPSTDRYEYWLLDPADESPLALIFACVDGEQMADFPDRAEWTALSAAAMRVARTPEEEKSGEPPVNYRVERMVAERAGPRPRGQWFTRSENEAEAFPPLLLKEDWEDPVQSALCQRYIQRQSTRLLMLHGLQHDDRKRLEDAARQHVFEVERFYPFYPAVADTQLMNAILVEARLRRDTSQ
jgi:hypothetical protein